MSLLRRLNVVLVSGGIAAIFLGFYSQSLEHSSPLKHTHEPNVLSRFMPAFLNVLTMSQKEKMRQDKSELFRSVSGDVIEIGVGTGANFEFMPWDNIKSYTVVEPNEAMFPYIQAEASRLGIQNMHYIMGPAENITSSPNLPHPKFDSLVSTLVLCSVNDVEESLAQYRGLLVPGGKYYFYEHVAAPDGSSIRSAQRILRWVWNQLFDGCWIDRETQGAIENAGFIDVKAKAGYLAPIVPTILGTATNPK